MSVFVYLQHFLPKRALSNLVGWLTRRQARGISHAAIRAFVRAYNVDLSEAEITNTAEYASFNAFFTRALAPGQRPQPDDENAVSAAADGSISEIGELDDDTLVQAKGINYSLSDLFAGDERMAEPFRGGHFQTIYLAPHNYHRVHMPLAGRATMLRYMPGKLFSVNARTAASLPGLFCRNERVCVTFDADGGQFALIMVGALNVGSIDLVLPASKPFSNRPAKTRSEPYSDRLNGPTLSRGDEFGRFNMGSTVIVLATPGLLVWDKTLTAGDAVKVGAAVGLRLKS